MKDIKILLVDDDEGICDSLSRVLTHKGCNVDISYSGEGALKNIKKTEYDILLTDLKMPGMNGIELLKEARKIAPEMGTIIMTGYGEITSYLEAMDLGADEYLNKPIKSNDLEIIIKKLAEGRGKSTKKPDNLQKETKD